MLDYAREAIAMTAGHTRANLDADRKLNLALVEKAVLLKRRTALFIRGRRVENCWPPLAAPVQPTSQLLQTVVF